MVLLGSPWEKVILKDLFVSNKLQNTARKDCQIRNLESQSTNKLVEVRESSPPLVVKSICPLSFA